MVDYFKEKNSSSKNIYFTTCFVTHNFKLLPENTKKSKLNKTKNVSISQFLIKDELERY